MTLNKSGHETVILYTLLYFNYILFKFSLKVFFIIIFEFLSWKIMWRRKCWRLMKHFPLHSSIYVSLWWNKMAIFLKTFTFYILQINLILLLFEHISWTSNIHPPSPYFFFWKKTHFEGLNSAGHNPYRVRSQRGPCTLCSVSIKNMFLKIFCGPDSILGEQSPQ